MKRVLPLLPAIGWLFSVWLFLSSAPAKATIVQLQTSFGDIEVNLYDEATPQTVANFLAYLESGAYTNTFFHRSVGDFVLQAGGYVVTNDNKIEFSENLLSPKNEPVFSNVAGTIAMAKMAGDANSATNQWFFNLGDNSRNLDVQNGGFTVFGEVIGGLEVLNAIEAVQTYRINNTLASTPLRNFSTDKIAQFNAAPADFLVMIHDIVVIDADEDTAANLKPAKNVLLSQSQKRKKSGSLSLMLLMTVLGVTLLILAHNRE